MNWAEAKVLVALSEGKAVKLHLPAPFHSPPCGHGSATGNGGRSQGLTAISWGNLPLLGYKTKGVWLDLL